MPYTGPMPVQMPGEPLVRYLDRLDDWDRKEERRHRDFMGICEEVDQLCGSLKGSEPESEPEPEMEEKEADMSEGDGGVAIPDTSPGILVVAETLPEPPLLAPEDPSLEETFNSLLKVCVSLRKERKRDASVKRRREVVQQAQAAMLRLVETAEALGNNTKLLQVLAFMGGNDPLRPRVRKALSKENQ